VQDEETGKQDLKREIRTMKSEVTAAEKQKGRILLFVSNLTAVYRLLWIRKNRA